MLQLQPLGVHVASNSKIHAHAWGVKKTNRLQMPKGKTHAAVGILSAGAVAVVGGVTVVGVVASDARTVRHEEAAVKAKAMVRVEDVAVHVTWKKRVVPVDLPAQLADAVVVVVHGDVAETSTIAVVAAAAADAAAAAAAAAVVSTAVDDAETSTAAATTQTHSMGFGTST